MLELNRIYNMDCLEGMKLLDDVYPESLGGKTELENLVTACRSCNIKKGVKLKDDING